LILPVTFLPLPVKQDGKKSYRIEKNFNRTTKNLTGRPKMVQEIEKLPQGGKKVSRTTRRVAGSIQFCPQKGVSSASCSPE